MPKKFASENTKAVAAKARKAAARDTELEKKQKAQEDAFWQDDDKNLVRKQQRKDEKEKKKQEVLMKKTESKALLEEEMSTIQKPTKQPIAKVARAQILLETEKRQLASSVASTKPKSEPIPNEPLVENINRIAVEGVEARSITDAIQALSTKEVPIDKHPERRVKAAYNAFEEKRLPELKKENPTLRLSQLKQLLKKEWMHSSENPLNQFFKNS